MFQSTLRRVLASASLASFLFLLPVHAADPRSGRPQQQVRKAPKNGITQLVAPLWMLLSDLLETGGVTQTTTNPNEGTGGDGVSVRIDPNGTRVTTQDTSR